MTKRTLDKQKVRANRILEMKKEAEAFFSESWKIHDGLPSSENWERSRLWHKKEMKYRNEIIKMINLFLRHKVSYSKMSSITGIERRILYKFGRYGLDGRIPTNTKRDVRMRDVVCRMCKTNNTLAELHTHHIGDSRKHNIENLIALCASCHKKAEKEKRGDPLLHIQHMNCLIWL